MNATRRITTWFSVFSLIAAAVCYASYRLDCRELRAAAEPLVIDMHTTHERVLSMLHWVHANLRTSENDRFFLWRGLRATPLQVLHGGGDCADKSRLLSAMLRQIGIPATMIMCFDSQTLAPTHTVVCAFFDSKNTMVVDPAYGLSFPRPDAGGYFGLQALRNDSSILVRRLAELRRDSPSSHPVHSYNAQVSSYQFASSVNWNKNSLTRSLHDALYPLAGEMLYSWPRPLFVEEPKLLVSMMACAAALAALAVSRVLRRMAGFSFPRQCVPVGEGVVLAGQRGIGNALA